MKNNIKLLHWLPRVICILAIIFISLFAFDSFEGNHSFWQKVSAFLIHLIPTYILTALLIIAWKWEFAGGISFLLIGVAFSPYVFTVNYNMNHSVLMSLGIIATITFPFILIGILFIISYYQKKKL